MKKPKFWNENENDGKTIDEATKQSFGKAVFTYNNPLMWI